jgi:opacity protein-like surface antigen
MQKLSIASVAIATVALSAPVLAADMPPYQVAAGPVVGGFDWEGFYVGGTIGGAWNNTSFNQTNVSWTGLPGGGSTSVNTGLFYGTGGFGWDYDKFTRSQLTAPFSAALPFVDTNALQAGTVVTSSRMRAGWVAGLGVEWAFARTWTVKLEYLHFDTEAETLSGGNFTVRLVGGGTSATFGCSVPRDLQRK